MKKIKVIHFIPGFNTGGIESRLIDWYKNMNREKIEFIVIKSNNIDNSDKLKELISLGGRFYNLPHFELKNMIKFFNQLKTILKIEKPDILHVHSLNTGVFALSIAKRLGIKTRIAHARTTRYLPNAKNVWVKKFLRIFTPLFTTDYFACSMEAGLYDFGKKRENKIRVIKNGIDLPNFYFDVTKRNKIRKELNVENNIVIGSISRLSPQKNIMFLLDVFCEINKQNNNYRLVLVGDGDEEIVKEIKEKISLLKLDKFVILVGNKSDVWNYYMAFDIFLGTSFYEGFGTTAVESQATGLPTILSMGFPKIIEITKYVKRISLDEDAKEWAKQILNVRLRQRTKDDAKAIDFAGYNAKYIGKELEQFYCSKANSK